MIHRNICPICGSENPEGSIVCQGCKANLQNLPDDMFPSDPIPDGNMTNTGKDLQDSENDELDLDSSVPVWLQEKLQRTDKNVRKEKVDFESFADALFDMPDSRKNTSSVGKVKPKKAKKSEPVYQPSLGNLIDSPLIEPDAGMAAAEPKNYPGIVDFTNIRPVKKWDDPKTDAAAASVNKQSDKVFQTTAVQVPLWWQQDAPLVETDPGDEAEKSVDADDSLYLNSVSPTKVLDPDEVSEDMLSQLNIASSANRQNEPESADQYKPENGSLLSDLMNDMNSSSVSLTPSETRKRESGTVFYSGSGEDPSEQQPVRDEPISGNAEETLSSAEALDQILRGMGYQTEEEIAAESTVAGDQNGTLPAEHAVSDSGDSGDTAAAESFDSADEDPLLSQSKISVKEDLLEEPDIPWDLFGSQDMSLPQSPEEKSYQAFSRSGLSADQESTTYQQRMMSSILEKIIYAENFVPAVKRKNERAVGMAARLFWSLLALGGVVLTLMTGITDSIELPAVEQTSDTQNFWSQAEEVRGDALVVVDYSPAYAAELDNAADELIETLADHADDLWLAALNPAVMSNVQRILQRHEDRIEFSGWWPAGNISIRSRMASGDIPEQIWLITSESTSVRDWAEQLSASVEPHELHVLASGQLEPLLQPYLASGMVAGAASRDQDLMQRDHRTQTAVLFLAALLPIAWLGGIISGFLKRDPNYGHKGSRTVDPSKKETEKEAVNDGRL